MKLQSYKVTKNKRVTKLQSYKKKVLIMEVSVWRKGKEHKILIDDEDYDKIKDLSLNIIIESYRFKERVVNPRTGFSLHRFIVESKPNQICIHKNNNRLDFRKENLFITTRKELKELIKKGEIQQRFDDMNRVYYEFN